MGQNFFQLCPVGETLVIWVCFRGKLEGNSPMYLFPFASNLLERSVNLLFFLSSSLICVPGGTPSGSLPGYDIVTTIFLGFMLD